MLDNLFKATGTGLRSILRPFLRWLRESKGATIEETDDSLLDEWVTIAMGQLGSAVSRVRDIFSDDEPPADGELPEEP